jgi:hypothetical protein
VIALFGSLALLGLAAIDPIGLAVMPLLLAQRRPFARSAAFLGGSLVSLMITGLLFAKGCGGLVLHFENSHTWLVPTVEITAGTILLGIAGIVLWQFRTGRLSTEPPARVKRQLRLNELHLFLLGAVLVAAQSIIDVVFVIAMIRIGQLSLSTFVLTAAVATYAVAALILQLAVVAAYALTSPRQRQWLLTRIYDLLSHYANQAVIGVSLVFGCGLFINGILTAAGRPHL